MADDLLVRLRSLAGRIVAPERPVVAVEVRQGTLGIVRLGRHGGRPALGTAAVLELPPGTVVTSLTEPNVRDSETFSRVLETLMERVGLRGGGRAALVLPDASARLGLFPVAGPDLEEQVRFRLRKVVPFDVRTARVAARRVGGEAAESVVLAAAMARPVLERYEEVLDSVGLQVGHVELSGLAIARHAMRRRGDSLLINWEEGAATFVLSRDGRPLLIRSFSAEVAGSLEEVEREAANTILYYRDRLAGESLEEALLRTGDALSEVARERLEESLGVEPRLVAPWGGEQPGLPDDGRAVAGAVAALLGEAA